MLLLGIELVNISASSGCKMLLILLMLMLLLLLILLMLLSDVSRVASIERWVLTVGLGIVAKLGWVVPLLVRISVAPVFMLGVTTPTRVWVVALLLVMLLVGRIVVWL